MNNLHVSRAGKAVERNAMKFLLHAHQDLNFVGCYARTNLVPNRLIDLVTDLVPDRAIALAPDLVPDRVPDRVL